MARSRMESRCVIVVLPEEDGPATRISRAPLARNFLRSVHQGNLVQFLVDADEFAQRALFDHFVEIGHVGDAQDLVPARAFGKGAHQLGQFHQPAGARGIRPVGQQQRQARQQQAQIEHRHIARGGNHFPIEVFRHAVALVELEVLIGPVVQKAHFVHIAARAEKRRGVLARDGALFKGQVRRDDRAHFALQRVHRVLGDWGVRHDIDAAPDGMLHAHAHPGSARRAAHKNTNRKERSYTRRPSSSA